MKMKVIFLVIVFVQVAAFADMNQAEKVHKQNIEVVKAAVKELSANLPKKVDAYTQLVDLKAEGENLIYTFEINAGAKSDETVIKEAKERQMNVRVTGGICRSSKRFLDSGIGISYIYRSAASKKQLFRYDVTEKSCVDLLGPAY